MSVFISKTRNKPKYKEKISVWTVYSDDYLEKSYNRNMGTDVTSFHNSKK